MDATCFSFLKIVNVDSCFVNVTTVRVFNKIVEAGELKIETPFTETSSAPVGLND